MSWLIELSKKTGITRRLNHTQTIDYPTPFYDFQGNLLGYSENNDLFRKRVNGIINNRKNK